MAIEVHTDELKAAAERLRRIGGGVSDYSERLDARFRQVAAGVDGELAASMTSAWAEVGRAIDDLVAGFERYGAALAQVADRYRELEHDVAPHPRP